MPEIDHSKIMDSITASKQYWYAKDGKAMLKIKEREEVMGLKFKQGEKVVDLVTGEEVEVIGGTRETTAVRRAGGD